VRKYALAAVLAGAMSATVVSLPNQASGMTIGAPIGILSAAPPTRIEQIGGWCGGRHGCWGRPYYQSPPYAYYSYRPWPYYNYFSGSGWPTYGWYR
jgi:hypothetical protein